MNYTHERDRFIAIMAREGLSLDISRRLLSAATTLNRIAELSCSSEAADRDRIPCPGVKVPADCCCDNPDNGHEDVPRIDVQGMRLKRRIRAIMPAGWAIQTQGDPRGCVLGVILPSYAAENLTRKPYDLRSYGVPSGPSGLRF